MGRDLTPDLALQLAVQLTEKDALSAHARDELGISEMTTARPIQTAFTSAATFSVGAALPLVMVLVVPRPWLIQAVALASLAFLALLGAVGARTGGAGIFRPTLRVMLWGALAMALTAGIGLLFAISG
ncbi:VIT family protein [Devosia psychrophila]|uniref:VIT family protein n=1 Tax=Devosia psychrophila TaxID=728005 RepID=A0A1I1Q5E7_9HYPH|nr:VIT family protein [Devosia psychrophila]